jgi:16S rRNA (guanine527-N7)-methyltransferase
LLVSEPPRTDPEEDLDTRWPAEPLRQLGLEPAELVHEGFEYRILRQREPCPDRFPRRNGVPAKRPLF